MANRVMMAKRVIMCDHKIEMGNLANEAVLTISEDDRWINVDYMNLNEGAKMSYSAALTFLERSDKKHLTLVNPVTVAHLDHIDEIIRIWNNKRILISSGEIERSMLERQLKFVMDRSVTIEKNQIQLCLDRGNIGESEESEMLSIESNLNGLGYQTVYECGNLYPYFLEYIKLVRNRNLFIDIDLQSVEPGFEKLFADLEWPFDDRMIAWRNQNMVHRSINLSFEGDSNEYLLSNGHYEEDDMDMDDLPSDSEGYVSDNI